MSGFTAWARRTAMAGAATALLAVGAAPAASATTPPEDPAFAAASGTQVIIVTAPSWTSQTAMLKAYEKQDDGTWSRVGHKAKAYVGRNGLEPGESRRQNTDKTPAGTYRLRWAFGIRNDPGTRMRYVRVDGNDVWPYDPRRPATYNVFQRRGIDGIWRRGWDEPLAAYGISYSYALVLDFNLPPGPIAKGADGIRRTTQPADTRRGGGIFLHATDGTPTAGCIAIPVRAMRSVLQWLDPDQRPTITIRVSG